MWIQHIIIFNGIKDKSNSGKTPYNAKNEEEEFLPEEKHRSKAETVYHAMSQ